MVTKDGSRLRFIENINAGNIVDMLDIHKTHNTFFRYSNFANCLKKIYLEVNSNGNNEKMCPPKMTHTINAFKRNPNNIKLLLVLPEQVSDGKYIRDTLFEAAFKDSGYSKGIKASRYKKFDFNNWHKQGISALHLLPTNLQGRRYAHYNYWMENGKIPIQLFLQMTNKMNPDTVIVVFGSVLSQEIKKLKFAQPIIYAPSLYSKYDPEVISLESSEIFKHINQLFSKLGKPRMTFV